MKLVKTSALVLAIVLISAVAYSQSAEAIVNRHLQVVGGLEKMKSIETMKVTGQVDVPMAGMTMGYTIHQKRPNKIHMEYDMGEMGKMVQAFDGETAWWVNPMAGVTEPAEMPEAMVGQVRMQANMSGFWYDREENGISLKYIGEEEKDGYKFDKIQIITAEGPEIFAFFEKESGLLFRLEITTNQMGQQVTSEQVFTDYAEENGLLAAHRIEIQAGPQQVSVSIDKIEYNVPIDDAMFALAGK